MYCTSIIVREINIYKSHHTKLGHTVLPICDNRLITIDHWILISCNTFLRASRTSNHDITTIKKVIFACVQVVVIPAI